MCVFYLSCEAQNVDNYGFPDFYCFCFFLFLLLFPSQATDDSGKNKSYCVRRKVASVRSSVRVSVSNLMCCCSSATFVRSCLRACIRPSARPFQLWRVVFSLLFVCSCWIGCVGRLRCWDVAVLALDGLDDCGWTLVGYFFLVR